MKVIFLIINAELYDYATDTERLLKIFITIVGGLFKISLVPQQP